MFLHSNPTNKQEKWKMRKEREKLTSPLQLGSDPPSNILLTPSTFLSLTWSKIASDILKLAFIPYKNTQTNINKKLLHKQKQPLSHYSFIFTLLTHPSLTYHTYHNIIYIHLTPILTLRHTFKNKHNHSHKVSSFHLHYTHILHLPSYIRCTFQLIHMYTHTIICPIL